jgi:hypothetical protein
MAKPFIVNKKLSLFGDMCSVQNGRELVIKRYFGITKSNNL